MGVIRIALLRVVELGDGVRVRLSDVILVEVDGVECDITVPIVFLLAYHCALAICQPKRELLVLKLLAIEGLLGTDLDRPARLVGHQDVRRVGRLGCPVDGNGRLVWDLPERAVLVLFRLVGVERGRLGDGGGDPERVLTLDKAVPGFFAVAVTTWSETLIVQLSVTSTPPLKTWTVACDASRAGSSVSVTTMDVALFFSDT